MKVLITEQLSQHRYKTPEGYLICVDAILARTGKQTYKHNQVYEDSKDEVTDVEVDRRPEEVFSPEAIASFENKPLTKEHPEEAVNIHNYKDLAVGFVRDVRRTTIGENEVLVGNVVVTDADAIQAIEEGLDFLSCGYDCDITQDAQPQQKNIRGNHVALCSNPRAGITLLQDSEEKKNVKYKGFTIEKIEGIRGEAYRIFKPDGSGVYLEHDVHSVKEAKEYIDDRFIRDSFRPINSFIAALTDALDETLPGGNGDGYTIEEIAKKHNVSVEQIQAQLDMGMEVELEHTNNVNQAMEIAMDHLFEMPDYYTRLDKMEQEGGVKDAIDMEPKLVKQAIDKLWDIGQMKSSFTKKDIYNKIAKGSLSNLSWSSFIEGLKLALTNIDLIKDSIEYVVMGQQLYNGIPVRSKGEWVVFKTPSKEKARKWILEKNEKVQSLAGFSTHYFLKGSE